MEYFYGQEADQFAFFRIPKALFTDPAYHDLSTDAKLLYGLMLDRMELSRHNGWFDGSGRAYIFFKREDIMEQLSIGQDKAAQLMKELEAAQLIERRRQGLGMPAMIYVGKFVRAGTRQRPPKREALPPAPHRSEKPTNGGRENRRPLVGKTDLSYKKNKTEENKTENLILSPPPCAPDQRGAAPDHQARPDKMGYERMLKENIEYDVLVAARPTDQEIIDGYVDLMAGICSSHRQWIKIASEERPRAEVRRQLLRLRREHITYVLDSMAATTTSIKNIRQYTLAALYNAPSSMAQYYTQLAARDFEEERRSS